MDKIDYSRNGIIHFNIIDFLMSFENKKKKKKRLLIK